MSTLANVATRIARLVDAGRIYYGQPTSALRDLLVSESRFWWVTFAYCEPSSRRPWGGGSNEDIETLLHEAQCQIYGCPIAWEDYRAMEQRLPGIVAMAMRLTTRPEGLCYYIPVRDLALFLCICTPEQREKAAALDYRELRIWVQQWTQIRAAGMHGNAAVVAAEGMRWLGRRDHAVGNPGDLNLAAAIPLLAQIDAPQFRVALLAMVQSGNDIAAAQDILAACGGNLKQLETSCAIAARLSL